MPPIMNRRACSRTLPPTRRWSMVDALPVPLRAKKNSCARDQNSLRQCRVGLAKISSWWKSETTCRQPTAVCAGARPKKKRKKGTCSVGRRGYIFQLCIIFCFYFFSFLGNLPLQSYWSLSCDHGLHCCRDELT